MNHSITINDIHKSFGKTEVLHGISLNVEKGSIYGLLGPSGCGKTTTVKIIAGITKATAGSVEILGEQMPSYKIMQQIGYMAQSAALYETLTAKENLVFFGKLYGLKKNILKDRINYVMETVNLTGEMNKLVSQYSGGMKRRLSLAVALLASPTVLILDEPTVGIDPLLRNDIWNEFKELTDNGITIIVTTHVMDEAEKCSYLSMMRSGKLIASGTPLELMEKTGSVSLEEAFIKYGRSGEKHEN
ncbi:MAG: ABC transporter ATP-binding protein [Peptostreptococcaceae bacterium]|nr:ABC transporter ATP-binding protein [Peptostreptococcaceae bacterium]